MTKKIIYGVAFYGLILIALACFIIMFFEVKDLRAENEQLQLDKEELRLELVDTQIQRDELLDAIWHENNRKMKDNDHGE
ncbi:hypothetical protein [Oceanobacillus oncorhynchi]|uniref:hypothetical protein n=1 Tax=Oceanobacillus oncorhynchi TaxID=545501 RepID=UPI0034D458AD